MGMRLKVLILLIFFLFFLSEIVYSVEEKRVEQEIIPVSQPKVYETKLATYLREAGIEFNKQDLIDYENASEIPLLLEYEKPIYSGIMKIPEIITDYTGVRIVPTEKTVVSDIKSAISSVAGKFKAQYKTVPYIAVDPPLARLKDFVSKLPSQVKKIYVDSKVKIMLNESVPIIKDPSKEPEVRAKYGVLDGSGVKIAIIDTGIDKTHPDLDDLDDNPTTNDPKIIAEKCFCSPGGWRLPCCPNGDDIDDNARDGNGHGTHVASIAAGTGQASTYKFVGVAPKAKLLGVKVLDDYGDGLVSDIISGIEWAVANGANIISMSLGCGPNCRNKPLEDAVKQAVSQGVVVVVAAGNSGPGWSSIATPGVVKEAITVGATYKRDYLGKLWCDENPTKDQVACFGSRGPTDDGLVKPDIVAPGVKICAARVINGTIDKEIQNSGRQSEFYICDNDNYYALSGTSMATPHVSGAVALILQAHPNWTPEEIKYALRNTAKDLNSGINTQGFGRIDALSAINLTVAPPIAKLKTSGYIVRNGTINIIGTATSANFKSYKVEYGKGEDPTSWVLLTESTSPVNDGTLAFNWDTDLVKSDVYSLKLTVADTLGYKSEDRTILFIDHELKEGWPVSLGDVWGSYIPTIADIDNDGYSEIIIKNNGAFSVNASVNVYDYRGNIKNGWPQKIGGGVWSNDVLPGVSVGDIDNDGKMEIVAGWIDYPSFNVTCANAWHYNGTKVNGWPIQCYNGSFTWGFTFSSMVLADLDKNGDLEIIGSAVDLHKVFILHHDGTPYPNWPQKISGERPNIEYLQQSPAVGDIDNDGTLEIIASVVRTVPIPGREDEYRGDGYIYAWYPNGSLVNGFPWVVYGCCADIKSPVLVDLDKDGDLEIGVGGSGLIFFYYYNGTLLKGWPFNVDGRQAQVNGYIALGDVDQDEDVEIVFGDVHGWYGDSHVYVLEKDGTVKNGWPQVVHGSVWTQPVIGDIDGDGRPDILTTTFNKLLYAWDADGNLLEGFPKILSAESQSGPAIGDIDNDGKVEVVAVAEDGKIFVWDLNGNYDKSKMEWPMFRNDEKHKGLYVKPTISPPRLTLTCKTTESTNCLVNSTCQCSVSNCNSGWIRARLPDNSEFAKYFTSTGFLIDSGSKSGTANGYISCNDDGKEYSTPIQIV
jgi:serine protease AprX